MEKCIVLFSGGLDSRLALKIMQKNKFNVIAVFFKLGFGCGGTENSVRKFCKNQKVQLKIFDCTKGELFHEYLEILKKAEHGRGKGINPCIDCKIFMMKKAKEFADKNKIDLIVTGEVLGERPMSQHAGALKLIESESGLSGRLLRPLSANLLKKTNAKISNLYSIQGRRREKQMQLAKKFKIDFPMPSGGCLLCEPLLKRKLSILLKKNLIKKETIKLIKIGRHFLIDNSFIVLGKNKKENNALEKIKDFDVITPKYAGPSALIVNSNKKIFNTAIKLIKAYSKKGSLKERKTFDKWRL